MEFEFKVKKLTHNDLVTLFSDSLYGNTMLGINNDDDFYSQYEKVVNKEGDCIEDKMADILLNGGTIKLVDYEADGELNKNKYNKNIKCYIDEKSNGIYEICLDDILKGMSKASDYVKELFIDEAGDMWTAYNLMQIILFGEEVYG